jgi:hypothetical protein
MQIKGQRTGVSALHGACYLGTPREKLSIGRNYTIEAKLLTALGVFLETMSQ